MAAAQTKYGIKLANTEYKPDKKKILALTEFPSGNLLSGFVEVSNTFYDEWVGQITTYHYWDVVKSTIDYDQEDFDASLPVKTKAAQRARLKQLFFEILFTIELGEDASALEEEYEDLLKLYNPTEV